MRRLREREMVVGEEDVDKIYWGSADLPTSLDSG